MSLAPICVVLVGGLVLATLGVPSTSWGQAPATQPAGQAQESQPQTPPSQPGQEPQPLLPPQQYQIQQPGQPLLPPGTPPSTTLPPWTPPTPPPPSQTNIPAPFPGTGPPLPGGPAFAGVPGLTIPGAFAPTIARIRGATIELHPTLRVGEEYSDNFFETTSGAEDNFRSILGPGFTLLLNGARTLGTAATTVNLVHDTAKNADDGMSVFPSANAAVRYALTPRVALTFSDAYIRNDEPVAVDAFGLRQGRQIYDSNSFTAAADWVLDRYATQAYYRNVLFVNEGTQNQQNGSIADTLTNIAGLNASTRIATLYILRGGYEFSNTEAINGSSSSGTNSTSHTGFGSISRQIGLFATGGLSSSYSYQTLDSTNIWNISLFGAYGLPTGLSAYAAVGYSLLNSDTESNQGTVSTNASISYRFARAIATVGVFQDFRQTAQQGQSFGTVETRSYFGSFVYQLTPFINALGNASYSENEGTGTGNNQNSGTAKTLTWGASLNWQVLQWLTASVAYTYTKQTGNTFNQGTAFTPGTTTGDFQENRATINLFATF
jgi:hypothetical protein